MLLGSDNEMIRFVLSLIMNLIPKYVVIIFFLVKAMWRSVFLIIKHYILNADSIKLTPPELLFSIFALNPAFKERKSVPS